MVGLFDYLQLTAGKKPDSVITDNRTMPIVVGKSLVDDKTAYFQFL